MLHINNCVKSTRAAISNEKVKHSRYIYGWWNDILDIQVRNNNSREIQGTHIASVAHAKSRAQFR